MSSTSPRHVEAIDLMEGLPASARQYLMSKDRRIALNAGDTLFEAGEEAKALYIVNKGTLGVYVNRPGTGRHLLALVGHGEVIGEMAVISGKPRSATAVAIRDCELIALSAEDFKTLEKSYPELSIALNRLLVHRLRETSRGGPQFKEPRTSAFLAAASSVNALKVAQRLARLLESEGSTVHIELPREDCRDAPDLARLESNFDHVFLCGDLGQAEWSHMCARQADRIVAVATTPGSLDARFPRQILAQRASHQLADLVILYPPGTRRPTGTADWLDALGCNRHFHVREDDESDWQRMARVIAGRSLGLVLSGGGARAYAHVGVLMALRDAGLQVDFVGGASMGAIIAACHAMGWSLDDSVPRIRQAFVERNPLSDYSLPIVGLVRGARVERLLEDHFGETQIPDLWRPFFCVSSNLTTGHVYVHRRGKVREALRASISLPGVLPPVSVPAGVLADGGVMNNLPADIMAGGNSGPIVAVDVARDLAVTPAWLEKAKAAPLLYRMLKPPIISILMRAGTVTSEEQNRSKIEAADLVLSPPLGDIDIRDWRAFDRAVEIGYRYASNVIAQERDRLLKPRLRR